jgi:pimeloyl-ACP methyl ester carboxylesterase
MFGSRRGSVLLAAYPPPGQIIDVGSSKLHLRVSGAGAPAVVLEAGIAATSLSWALVEPEVAKLTRVVSYDRAGLGWSSAAATPRIPSNIARELRQALRIAGVEPPFLMVGHSFGGLLVRRFASDYPDDVSGLVLLDPLVPSEWYPLTPARRRMLGRGVSLSRRGAFLARLGVVRASLNFLLSGNRLIPRIAARLSSGAGGSGVTDRLAGEIRKLPRELWPVIAWHWSQSKNFEGMARHLESLPASAAEMIDCAASTLPVSVLLAGSAATVSWPRGWDVRKEKQCGHWVQLDRPDLVLSTIARMVADIRSTVRSNAGKPDCSG